MIHPSGHDALEVRQRYLKQRRAHPAGRTLNALWVAFGALVSWLFIVGFVGLAH